MSSLSRRRALVTSKKEQDMHGFLFTSNSGDMFTKMHAPLSL